MTKRKHLLGDVVQINLGKASYAYGLALTTPLFAFFDINPSEPIFGDDAIMRPAAFSIWVMDYSTTEPGWSIIGNFPIPKHVEQRPAFYKRDAISKKITITFSGAEKLSADGYDLNRLECAAVWEPKHVVDRLLDFFAGRQNKWVQSMRS